MNNDLSPCPFCGNPCRDLMGYEYHKVSCSNEFCPVYDCAFTKERWEMRNGKRVTEDDK